MSIWKLPLLDVEDAEIWSLVAAMRAEGPAGVPRSAWTPKVLMPYLPSRRLESSLVRDVDDLEV